MTLNGVSYEAEGTKETVRNEAAFKALLDLDTGNFFTAFTLPFTFYSIKSSNR